MTRRAVNLIQVKIRELFSHFVGEEMTPARVQQLRQGVGKTLADFGIIHNVNIDAQQSSDGRIQFNVMLSRRVLDGVPNKVVVGYGPVENNDWEERDRRISSRFVWRIRGR